ncbi:MAG: HEAT repeat domain-containing protein [Planctomycetota bacterium]
MIGRINPSWFRLLTVVGFVVCCGAVTQVARSEDDKTAQIEKLFREGVDLYSQGKYSDAQRKFHGVLQLDLRQELAARLVDEANTKVMAKMMADVRMGNEPSAIWQLYRKYYVGKLADKERMVKMVKRLVDIATSEDERALMYRELAELGHYAVTTLAPYLKDANHEDFRTYARIALARMGSRAVLPVIELIAHQEPLMRENAILVLSDIQPLDPRAIPAIKARIEDTNEKDAVKRVATRTLQRITGLPPEQFKNAVESYYDAANRYYLDRVGVAEEAEDVDGMIWHLNVEGDLISVQYPLWAWNDQMAEESLLKGMTVNSEHAAFYPLWACVQAAQCAEVKYLLDVVREQPTMHSFSVEEKKQIEEWDKKLVNARRLVALVGKEYCNAALTKTLVDIKKYPGHSRLPSVGAFLARELAMLDYRGELLTPPPEIIFALKPGADPVTVTSANAPITIKTENTLIHVTVKPASVDIVAVSPKSKIESKSEKKEVVAQTAPEVVAVAPVVSTSALVNGLNNTDQSVQYACAISLAEINRFPFKWIGSEKVAKILGRGVSESKAIQVLLVEENHDKANNLRGKIEGLGYGVTVAVSGRDALFQSKSYPPKDIAVVAENLRRDLNADQLFEEMRADIHTRYMPVGVLLARNDRDLIKSRFGTEICLVEREAADNDLKTQIEAVAAKRVQESVPKRQAHEISAQCAQALTDLECTDSYIVVDDAVDNAIGALVNRPDDVRIPCATFLGNVEGGTKKVKAVEVLKACVLDKNNSVELRKVALRALGRIQKEGLEDIYVKAQADENQSIKDVSAEAFGQVSRANKAISDIVRAERIDKDKKEK